MIDGDTSVTLLGRAGLVYRKGPKSVRLDGELLVGKPNYVVFKYSMREWQESRAPLTDDERTQIMSDIERLFAQHRGVVVFE